MNLNSSGRWDMWQESLELLGSNWLFGIGALHYSLMSNYGFGHPHNLILQLGLEYGVVVLAILILLVLVCRDSASRQQVWGESMQVKAVTVYAPRFWQVGLWLER